MQIKNKHPYALFYQASCVCVDFAGKGWRF